ncbi:hypothetical protein K0M31_008879 [Melipona bicolor]|uniref:Uncharacterized protein n=1 Tax=Melipona bicolor TaxID=60889 RepID=A0AA40FQ11_9HYME|nr:hypothetical protein K0M31_008879 [Melipona bicolor]
MHGRNKREREVNNLTIVEMKDWETKQTVQKKKKLGGKSIDHDLTGRKKNVERTRGESKKGKIKRERSKGKDRREGGFSEEAPQGKRITNKRRKRQRTRNTLQEAVKTERGIEGERSDEEGSKRGKLLFWNVAGLERKDKDFWNCVKKYDFIEMTEIWVDYRGWERLKGKFREGFAWNCQTTKKEKKKERARGGIITGIKQGWEGRLVIVKIS